MDGWTRGSRVRKGHASTNETDSCSRSKYVRADGRAPDAHVRLNGVGHSVHLHCPCAAGRSKGRARGKRGRGQEGKDALKAEKQGQGGDDGGGALHLEDWKLGGD